MSPSYTIVLTAATLTLSCVSPLSAASWYSKWEAFGYELADFDDLDLNEDGIVDGADLDSVVADYGPYSGPFLPADIDLDHDVDGVDVDLVTAHLGQTKPAAEGLGPQRIYKLIVRGTELADFWSVDEQFYIEEYFGRWDGTQYRRSASWYEDDQGNQLTRYVCHDFATDRNLNVRRDGGEITFGNWEGAGHAVAYLLPDRQGRSNPLRLADWRYVSNSANAWSGGDQVWADCEHVWMALDGWLETYGLLWSADFQGYPSLVHWDNCCGFHELDQIYAPREYDIVWADPESGVEMEYFCWEDETWRAIVPEPGTLAMILAAAALGGCCRLRVPRNVMDPPRAHKKGKRK